MAKDTEKLIRQLSLISYLMAERRPVTASEIRQNVEGYRGMNEDAFARRFYADRAELEALGIALQVDKPVEGAAEQENYTLPPENFFLPPIEFTDPELAALQHRALAPRRRVRLRRAAAARAPAGLVGAAEPALRARAAGVALGITGAAGGHDLSQRLGKIETAIFRRKTITFAYYTMERDEAGPARSTRTSCSSRAASSTSSAAPTSATHPGVPPLADPRQGRLRVEGRARLPAARGLRPARVREPHPLAVRRRRRAWPRCGSPTGSPGRSSATSAATGSCADADGGGRVFAPSTRTPASSCPGRSRSASTPACSAPAELVEEYAERVELLAERHTGESVAAAPAAPAPRRRPAPEAERRRADRRDAAIRPERFARLVTLASILIEAGRGRPAVATDELCDRLQISEQELREDIGVLNVVNFGAGTYVLYAEMRRTARRGRPRRLRRRFARPARLLPVEAKALVAAIDLIGEHIPDGSLASVREKVVAALGATPSRRACRSSPPEGEDSEVAGIVSRAVAGHRLLRSSTTRRTRTSSPSARSSPTR